MDTFQIMAIDLEQYRIEKGWSYERLASELGLTQRRHARRWALGETWPDADRLAKIFRVTANVVTLQAMYERRLVWLFNRKNGANMDEDTDEVDEDTAEFEFITA